LGRPIGRENETQTSAARKGGGGEGKKTSREKRFCSKKRRCFGQKNYNSQTDKMDADNQEERGTGIQLGEHTLQTRERTTIKNAGGRSR